MVYKVLWIYHLQLKEGLQEVSVTHLLRMVTDVKGMKEIVWRDIRKQSTRKPTTSSCQEDR